GVESRARIGLLDDLALDGGFRAGAALERIPGLNVLRAIADLRRSGSELKLHPSTHLVVADDDDLPLAVDLEDLEALRRRIDEIALFDADAGLGFVIALRVVEVTHPDGRAGLARRIRGNRRHAEIDVERNRRGGAADGRL